MNKLKETGVRMRKRRIENTDVLVRKRRKNSGASVLYCICFPTTRPYGPNAVPPRRETSQGFLSLPHHETPSSSSLTKAFSPHSANHTTTHPPRHHVHFLLVVMQHLALPTAVGGADKGL